MRCKRFILPGLIEAAPEIGSKRKPAVEHSPYYPDYHFNGGGDR